MLQFTLHTDLRHLHVLLVVYIACCCRRRLYLPADLSQGAGLDPEEVFAGRSSKALQTVAEQVATRAQVAYTFMNAILEPLELRLSSVGLCDGSGSPRVDPICPLNCWVLTL